MLSLGQMPGSFAAVTVSLGLWWPFDWWELGVAYANTALAYPVG